eukprot:5034899-Pyramimonas_sp.AAC.1
MRSLADQALDALALPLGGSPLSWMWSWWLLCCLSFSSLWCWWSWSPERRLRRVDRLLILELLLGDLADPENWKVAAPVLRGLRQQSFRLCEGSVGVQRLDVLLADLLLLVVDVCLVYLVGFILE